MRTVLGKVGAAALAAVLCLGVAACGNKARGASSGPVDTTGTALVEAAKKEGSLLFYCALAETTCSGLGDAFTKKYPGVKVNAINIVSAKLGARYAAEKKSGAPTADVMVMSDANFVQAALADKKVMSWKDAGYLPSDFPSDFYDEDAGSPFHFAVLGIAYNTQLVPSAEVPKTWADLLDPKWKGKMDGPSPAVTSAIAVAYGTIGDYVGDDFLTKLGKQKVTHLAGGMGDASAQLAAGEYAIQVIANNDHVLEYKSKGAPVDITYPQGTTGPPFLYALNAQPEHPNAQKLFAQWLVSPDADQVLLTLNPGGIATASAAPPGVKAEPPDVKYFESDKQTQVLDQLGIKQ